MLNKEYGVYSEFFDELSRKKVKYAEFCNHRMEIMQASRRSCSLVSEVPVCCLTMIILGDFMTNGWLNKRPALRMTLLMLAMLFGNMLAILILCLGCVPFAAFIFWHILRMQLEINMGTFIFFMILLYAVLIIYTMIASCIHFFTKRYKNSLLLAFVPMIIALMILLFFTI